MVNYLQKARQPYKSKLTNYSLYEACFGVWKNRFFANSTDYANNIKTIHFMMDMTEDFQKDTEKKLVDIGYKAGVEFVLTRWEASAKGREDKVKEWNKERDDLNRIIKKKDRELKKYLQSDRQTYKLIDIKKLTDFLNNHPNYVPIRNTDDKFLVKKINK